MATEVVQGSVLNLEERGRRLLERWSEQLVSLEFEDERGLWAREAQGAGDSALYRHLLAALENWQAGDREGDLAPAQRSR